MDSLISRIENSAWFSNLGEDALFSNPRVRTPDDLLQPFWDWLPTSRDEDPPPPVPQFDPLSSARHERLAAVRKALKAMRAVPQPHPRLVTGPHDFSYAARGAAEFVVRHSVAERQVSAPGVWCELLEFYLMGYWPVGMKGSQVVVY